MAQPSNKAELLDLVESAGKRWDDLLTQVGPARMEIAGVVGEWSVKDVVSHLTAWESRPVAWLKAVRSGKEPEPAPWDPKLDETETNAWIRDHNRNRLLQEVLDESRRTHLELVRMLRSADEKDLFPDRRYTWLEGNSLLGLIAGNTYEHYGEHAEQVQAWLARQRSR